MNNKNLAVDSSARYRIRAQGFLHEALSEMLAGMEIDVSSVKDDVMITSLTGRMRDQAELIGVLNCLYEMHLPLVSVEFLGP